jgi:PTS system fructose-specific IIC component
MKKIVAVTGCPTGIAHTYMAQESLQEAAKKLEVEIKVETNGASGVENRLTAAEIEAAEGVIVAADVDVNLDRFNGKAVIDTSVQDGIHRPEELIEQILAGEAEIRQGVKQSQPEKAANASIGRQIYKHLMNGVSKMLPFVVGGGILIAVSFLWGIHSADPNSDQYNAIAAMLNQLGGTAFGLMVPILAGYIAFSIADKAGLAAGFVGGVVARDTGAGYLGGIIIGFFAGYLMAYCKKLMANFPKQLEGLKSIFLLPLIGIFISGTLMYLLGAPVSAANQALKAQLEAIQTANPIILGIVIGCMSAFDMGGPVNKAAYITGTMLLGEGNYEFMAGVSAACITPPLLTALATTIFRKEFTEEEKANGLVNYILGSTHITEGAIPFAAQNPLVVIPILMIGSSISAVLTYMLQIEVPAPHGGFLILPLVNKPFLWVGTILLGSLVGALLYGFYRKHSNRKLTAK